VLLILISTAWLAVMTCSVSLCRAAADGDDARTSIELAAASGSVVVEERSRLAALLHGV
jgi:hypothetical protein